MGHQAGTNKLLSFPVQHPVYDVPTAVGWISNTLTMSNVVMICRAFEVSGLEGESKCMLKSPSMISFPRRVL